MYFLGGILTSSSPNLLLRLTEESTYIYYMKEISISKLIKILVMGAMLKVGEEGDRAGKTSQGTAYFILN